MDLIFEKPKNTFIKLKLIKSVIMNKIFITFMSKILNSNDCAIAKLNIINEEKNQILKFNVIVKYTEFLL